MATGVLPVCIGKATRIIEYYDNDRKTYRACMKFGYTSDTLDIWGNTEKTGGYSDVTHCYPGRSCSRRSGIRRDLFQGHVHPDDM